MLLLLLLMLRHPYSAKPRDKYRFCYKLVPFLRRTFLRIFCVFLSILSAFGPKGCIQFMHLTTHFCAS